MITFQQQPTEDTCMITCLAMLLDRPVREMMDKYHDLLYKKEIWLDDILDDFKIPYFYGHPRKAQLNQGFVYLLTVASLNIQGGLHEILLEFDRSRNITVFDPNKGKEGIKYYVYGDPKNDNEVSLVTWTIDLGIGII